MLQPSYEAPLPRVQAHRQTIGARLACGIYSRHASHAVWQFPGSHDPLESLYTSATSVHGLAPINFRRGLTRLVSYYALFE